MYDGDTFWALFDVQGRKIRNKIRLRNIDTAEVRGKDKEKGKEIRDYVANIILGKNVNIFITGIDPYFRHLAFVYPDKSDWEASACIQDYDREYKLIGGVDNNLELNEYLINKGMADKKYYKKRTDLTSK